MHHLNASDHISLLQSGPPASTISSPAASSIPKFPSAAAPLSSRYTAVAGYLELFLGVCYGFW